MFFQLALNGLIKGLAILQVLAYKSMIVYKLENFGNQNNRTCLGKASFTKMLSVFVSERLVDYKSILIESNAVQEAVIVIVGFLGVGKTTLLTRLVQEYLKANWQPYIILNDYQNAVLDSQRFLEFLQPDQIQALSGSCICCSGVVELRRQLNSIPERKHGVTFIEANGTSDACSLMEFLGVGLKEQFLPPIQISVVDVQNWQKRGYHNELEANQVQVSSLVVLNHAANVSPNRVERVKADIASLNSSASFKTWSELDSLSLPNLKASNNSADQMDHKKAHWASCSVDLPDPIDSKKLIGILESLPDTILRVKGCTRMDQDEHYSYFEKIPSGDIVVRPYRGTLASGTKLLVVGPGSDPEKLRQIIDGA
ncbi:GTP-binding protein [Pseudobacteriovorax antillogorgiicola]|uniref:GTPase, G3E family n=1 Tax=Pseudobacteriovorax antillogorgiicola TaxID=1513793 RepID=A0A1Y6CFK9_9BACT|nr:GTP-binding protein [Pseudobacteriovorax antillogorgiicola]TCS47992.1 G3E family GTPase [Pseudobacteriovorax antillogorgiicola]SMF58463.1 GTPase, G3E family [Pseudobacteriovorax antillogorgiicola]